MDDGVSQIESLYRQHGPEVMRYLRRLVGGESVEDLLQETFAEALRGWDRLAAAESPRAWLLGIARNLGRNAIRRRRVFAPLPDDLGCVHPDQADERVERMRRQIERLSEPMREVLELRLRHELSYEEIARVLAVPVGTVRSRLHNAVRQLRETLREA